MNGESQHYEEAQKAVERAMEQANSGSAEERAAVKDALLELEKAADKLRNGRVEIVVFGEINVGKSSLINAILGETINDTSIKGGMTTKINSAEWKGSGYRVQGFANSSVVIVDTPGINEVQGFERERIARAATESADLILFVTDSDLNEIEFQALRALAGIHKPIILVFNQIDKYRAEERKRLLEVLRDERLPGIIHREDIVEASAAPLEREFVIQSPDGSERIEMRQPAPNVGDVKLRILQILQQDGKALLALNAAMFAADRHDKIVALRFKMREDAAVKTIWSWMVTKALAVSLTPIPVVDIVGGSAADIAMVMHLADVYGVEMNKKTARDLLDSILGAAGLMLVTEWAVHIGAGVLKGVTFGLSTLATAIPQGAAAGYASYIVGNSAKYYFEHNSAWGPEGAKSVVRNILEHTDKKSIIGRLSDAIRESVKKNRHAKAPAA